MEHVHLFAGEEYIDIKDMQTQGRGRTNWKIRNDIHTLPCANRQLVGSCYKHRELSSVLCDDLQGWDGGFKRKGGIYR